MHPAHFQRVGSSLGISGNAVTLCRNFTAISRSPAREAATARCQLTRAASEHPLGGSLGCRGATGVNRPRRQSVAPSYSLWSRHSDDECARHRPGLGRRDTSRGSHWNKRRPEAVLPVGRSAQERPRSRDERARLPVFTGARVGVPMFSLRLTGVSFAMIIAVACGSDYSTPPTAPSPTPAPALTPGGATSGVAIQAGRGARLRAYAPAELNVAVGTSVTSTNNDPKAAQRTPTPAWYSGVITPRGRLSVTFETPGTFSYRSAFAREECAGSR